MAGRNLLSLTVASLMVVRSATMLVTAEDISSSTNSPPDQPWNWHIQNTDIVQGYPSFTAKYSGRNSLLPGGQTRETVSLDLMAALHLWPGAEAHIDGLLWQGY